MAIASETSGARIKTARINMGLSQQALAEQTGLSVSQISKLEQNATDITRLAYRRVAALADALEVPVAWLATGDTAEIEPKA